MTGGMHCISTYSSSADITPEMLKLCRVTKVNKFFLALVFAFNFDLFEFSATILEKSLLGNYNIGLKHEVSNFWSGLK